MRMPADLIKDLENLGEASVRAAFLNGDYKPPSYEIVREWLSSKESLRADMQANKALRSARLANIIAAIAVAIAIIAMVLPFALKWFHKN